MDAKVISLVQGTEEWKLFRELGCGSSESSVLMGLNKYETLLSLYLRKIKSPLYVPKEINEAMMHGTNSEAGIRDIINLESGTNFQPVCLIHKDKDCIRSSMDGLDGNIGLEIKAPYNDYSFFNHRKKISPFYYSQVQHHILTGNLREEYFVSSFENKKVGYRILPNPSFIAELELRICKFWECVLDKREPDYFEYGVYEY